MISHDTIELLKECDAGAKMAVASLDEVLEKVENSDMRQLLSESKSSHKQISEEIHTLLERYHSVEKDPAPIARGMSWLKTNIMMEMKGGTSTVANLITDGCNMGVKNLHKYLNQYQAADAVSKDICNRLVSVEEQLCRDLQDYL